MEPLGKKPGIFSIITKSTRPGMPRTGAFLLPKTFTKKPSLPEISQSLQKTQTVKRLMDSLGMSTSRTNLDTVAALMGEFLPLNPRNIGLIKQEIPARLKRKFDESKGANEKRLLARALALGIDDNTELLDRILQMPGFSTPEEKDGSDKTEEQFPDLQVLGKSLARLLPRYLARALKDQDLSMLARPGRDGRIWIFAPFEFSVNRVFFHGVFRILFSGESRQFQRICADIHTARAHRVFLLSPGKDGPVLREVERDDSELELLEMSIESS